MNVYRYISSYAQLTSDDKQQNVLFFSSSRSTLLAVSLHADNVLQIEAGLYRSSGTNHGRCLDVITHSRRFTCCQCALR